MKSMVLYENIKNFIKFEIFPSLLSGKGKKIRKNIGF